MSRSIFGWSYPPGAASDPSAPYNAADPPCEMCGRDPYDCICPECPECGDVGNPSCYEQHGLVANAMQLEAIRNRKVADTVDRAQLAFWAVVAASHPEVKSGDLPMRASFEFDAACKSAVTAWLKANSTPCD